ncbi:MAG: phosphatase PAP2 family protein [Pseudomonadota bacterium]
MSRKPLIIVSILLLCFLIFELSSIDVYIQDFFYNFESKHWLLNKNAVIPKLIFYDGIKKIFIAFVISILIMLLFFRHKAIIKPYKKGLLIVLLSCIIVPLFISFLKATTNIPCPKDIQRYGGNYPYVRVLTSYPDTFQQTGKIKCYPAGHASGGFALMSLYFLFFSRRKKQIALIAAISIGWAIGDYKMIIGDHFFSHTLITMIISWLIILFIARMVDRAW